MQVNLMDIIDKQELKRDHFPLKKKTIGGTTVEVTEFTSVGSKNI